MSEHTTESDAVHFWHPDLLHELHPGADPSVVTCTDDLRRMNCPTCQSVLIDAVRAARTRVIPPGEGRTS